jgi:hypothetical protein
MTIIDQKIKELSYYQKIEVIRDFNKFQNNGAIGECLLRNLAREYNSLLGNSYGVVRMMESIAFGVFRHIALEAIERNTLTKTQAIAIAANEGQYINSLKIIEIIKFKSELDGDTKYAFIYEFEIYKYAKSAFPYEIETVWTASKGLVGTWE